MALKYVLDTSSYSAFNRNQNNLEKFINVKAEVFIPLIVIGELRAGFLSGKQRKINELLLCNFLDAPNVNILVLSEKTTKHYANIYTQLRQIGKPIGTNDMWIAALCLEYNLPLLTLDSHFQEIKNLDLIKI